MEKMLITNIIAFFPHNVQLEQIYNVCVVENEMGSQWNQKHILGSYRQFDASAHCIYTARPSGEVYEGWPMPKHFLFFFIAFVNFLPMQRQLYLMTQLFLAFTSYANFRLFNFSSK